MMPITAQWLMRTRNKLNAKQVERLTKPGIYSKAGGLYLRVRNSGTRSWLYVHWLNGRRRELGLGSLLDISLAKAHEKAAQARALYLDAIGRPLNVE
ncbi:MULTISPECIES: Arm DNA-binding domain-containing protein [unclassified Sphingobium]|uniref:Arm DNA-binding domain-containing protein n=1 Tax=unclassified Sphingobium TaxID=2611147 RepID=UPI0022240441|nr:MULTISPECIES: Arm DNA-binding domain-containing protein [unclassified Sphingobium]MCW2396636.1 hypothetical protein [Sphingobium sp. B8D3B]MCW2420153.1 hypothetical protein [Sphingobium sp. B8D3C]